MTAPARRSVRKQPTTIRKPTTRSLTQPQNAAVPARDTEEEEDEEEEEEEDEEEERDDEDEDDDSSDGLSITRCLCGEQHNVGLMVQCDKCEVWQHCDCVGLTEQEMPELYYCDQCQPDNHILYKIHGRYKRAYNPNGHTEQKRMASSSSTKTTDESVGRSSKRRKPNGRANPPKSPMTTRNQRATRHKGGEEESAEENQPADEAASEADERSRSGENMSPLPEEIPASPASSRTNNKKSPSKSRKNANTSPRKKTSHSKGSPRPSTPQDDPLSPVTAPTSYWDEDGLPAQDDTVPARIKYPNPKMSIADMNKRAKQIFEYITKLQDDLAPKGRPRSNSTCSSLSSASTLPLIEEDTLASPTTPVPVKSQDQESVLDIMERVTCDLIQFQRKFGMGTKR